MNKSKKMFRNKKSRKTRKKYYGGIKFRDEEFEEEGADGAEAGGAEERFSTLADPSRKKGRIKKTNKKLSDTIGRILGEQEAVDRDRYLRRQGSVEEEEAQGGAEEEEAQGGAEEEEGAGIFRNIWELKYNLEEINYKIGQLQQQSNEEGSDELLRQCKEVLDMSKITLNLLEKRLKNEGINTNLYDPDKETDFKNFFETENDPDVIY